MVANSVVFVTSALLKSSYSREFITLPLALQLHEVPNALVKVVAVVLEGGLALLHWRNVVEHALQKLVHLFLLKAHHAPSLGFLLVVALDDRPQRFDRVELGGVRRHQQQLEVELLSQLCSGLRLVGGVAVEHDVALLVGLERLTDSPQKPQHRVLVGAAFDGEDGPIQAGADGAEDGLATVPVLPEDEAHGSIGVGPGVRLLLPEVEGGFIEVDEDLVLVPQLGDAHGEVVAQLGADS